MPIDKAIIERMDNEALVLAIRQHATEHGWPNVAKVLRKVVCVHVGWDSAFTELDNALRRIERDFENSCRPDLERDLLAQREQDRTDVPDSELEPPASYFS